MFGGVGQSEYSNVAQSTLKSFYPTVCFTIIGIIKLLNKLYVKQAFISVPVAVLSFAPW